MTAERFARLRALVEAGHDLGEAELERLLDARCGGDADLRAEALELVRAARAAAAWLEPPAGGWGALAAGRERRLGGFRIGARIGAGGMGTVFLAEQDEPRRTVALKMLRLGFDGEDDVRRFRREAEILGRLHHPNVAQVFAAGVEPDPTGGPGLPWYALEFVADARDLCEHARELALDARLELFATLCRAVQHAHERGVVHRDLKPGNVLVDGAGVLKVIDFGVASLAGAAATRLTRTGALLGTLDHMAPERLRGEGEEHDTRGDVYALGVMLYELVSGRPPHDLTGASVFAAARLVGERDPAPPSSFAPAASRDLDAVVGKALARERQARYSSAEALAEDVERVRRGEPVQARPPTVLRQLRGLARRHRLPLAAAAGGLIALCAGLVVSTALLLRALRAERDARNGEEAYRRRDYVASVAAAHGALRAGDVRRAAEFLERAPASLRGFEWEHLRARTDRSDDTWTTGAEVVDDLAWLPDGGRVAVALRDGRVELLGAGGERLARLRDPGEQACALAADPSGGRVAVALAGGKVELLPTEVLGARSSFAAHAGAAYCVAFSRDGARLATGGADGRTRVWIASSAELALELDAGPGWAATLAFLPAGDAVAIGTSAGVVVVCDATTGERRIELADARRGQLAEVAVSADGALLAAAYHDGVVRVWSLPDGAPGPSFQAHAGIVERVAFAPSGARLASAGRDRSVALWDARTGERIARLLGHAHELTALGWTPDGSRLASGDETGCLKLWSSDAADVVAVAVRGRWEWRLAYAPGGEVLCSVHGGFAELRDPRTGRVLETLPALPAARPGGTAEWRAVAFDPTGHRLALGDDDGRVQVLDRAGSQAPVAWAAGVGLVRALAWSPDGVVVVAGGWDARAAAFSPRGEPAEPPVPLGAPVEGLAYAADGTLAVLDAAGELVLVRPDGERSRHRLSPGTSALAWCGPERLAIGAADGSILTFDARVGAVTAVLAAHGREVEDLAASPDGTRLASSSRDRSIRMFDLERGVETWVNDEHDYLVLAVAFAPDGRTLASGSADGTLRLWDTRPPSPGRIRAPDELAGAAWMLALAPEADRAALEPLAAELRRRAGRDGSAGNDGRNAELLRSLAAVELALGRAAESLAALDRLPAADAEAPELFLLRSIALGRLGRTGEALAARERGRTAAGARARIGLCARLLERSMRAAGS